MKYSFGFMMKRPDTKQALSNWRMRATGDSLTFNRVIKNSVAQGGCPDTPDGKLLFLIQPICWNRNSTTIFGMCTAQWVPGVMIIQVCSRPLASFTLCKIRMESTDSMINTQFSARFSKEWILWMQ